MDIKTNLNNALEIIFNESENIGFWDNQNKIILEKLVFDKDWNWKVLKCPSHRYGLFTLSMILLSKDIYDLDTKIYDKKIISFIKWIYSNRNSLTVSELTYGGLLSIIVGKKIYGLDEIELNVVGELLTKTYNNIIPFIDNQNSLLLIASKYYLDQKESEEQLDNLKKLTKIILRSLNKSFFFETGDIRAIYHQRIMYCLWGLLFASNYYDNAEIRKTVEEVINYIWEKRRDVKDNAFLWHPAFYIVKNKYKIKIPIYNPESAKYLYECHQTFFANAINFYQKFFKTDSFQSEKEKAINWIFGYNRINSDLTSLTKLGIPIRLMSLEGEIFIKGQQFKGSYEIGSYILSLSEMIFSSIIIWK